MIYCGLDETDLLNTLDLILERLEGVGLYAAVHKCTFFVTGITWCEKVHSQGEVEYDPERLAGLAAMRRPETAGELMQFLQAVNWLCTSLPRMAAVVLVSSCVLEGAYGGRQASH